MAKPLTFQDALNTLLDSKKEIPQKHLPLYSDLDPKSLKLFLDVWGSVNPERKLMLLDALCSHLEEDMLVSYEELGRALLTDPESEVRARAISLLAETEDPRLVSTLVDVLLRDSELAPRLESANVLAQFVLLGELEEIEEALMDKIESALISVIKSDAPLALRTRALETLGYSNHAEVYQLIDAAFHRPDPFWVASALIAMGRMHDKERWNDDVISMLLDENPRIRLAAVRAAGELEIKDASPIIIGLLDDEEEDDEIALAAIWSLSQIGGEEARVYLVNLIEQNEDEDAVEFLEDALENLDFNEEIAKFDLLDFEDDEDEQDEKK
jgi:HEAT repeat protein